MTFLIIFICCAAELTFVSFEPFRNGEWVASWHAWLADQLGLRQRLGHALLFVTLALPCLAVAYLFGSIFAGSTLVTLFGGTAVLLFCCGPGDLAREIESYSNSYLDEEGSLPPPDMGNFLGKIRGAEGDPDRPYMRAVASEANDRLFAPMFWFCAIGPVGALLFRMSSILRNDLAASTAEAVLAERLYNILIWLPARMLGFGLGLAGSLGPVMRVVQDNDYGLSQSAAFLGDASLAALEKHEHDDFGHGDEHVSSIASMFALVKRGFVVWLVVLALLAAAGLV